MYSAYITTIKELRKHSNADRLQCATIFGNNTVVDMSYKLGDRVVYFPVDGQLSAEYAEDNNLVRKKDENGKNIGGYLDPNKRNITAIKLRGEKSEGLVMPIDTLKKYTDISELKDGDQITVLNGHEICRKYIPGSNRRHQNSASGKHKAKVDHAKVYPYFQEHRDTEQLAYNESAFHPGDTIYLTQKLHGTSMRIGNVLTFTQIKRPAVLKKIFHLKDKEKKEYKTISGTHRTILDDFDGGYYGTNAFRKKYQDLLKDKIPKGMEIYGEIVGWVDENTPIMPKCSNAKVKDKAFSKKYGEETVFTYGCEPGENALYVYRITMANEDGDIIELPTEDVIVWCDRLGLEYVPLLEKFLYTTWDDLNERCQKYLDVPEPLAHGAHVTEGVVVRIDNRDTFTAYKTKSWAFKVLESIIKDTSDAPDMEEAEELIGEERNSQ